MADECDICQEGKLSNQKETLKQDSNGSEPWNKIGLDLFEIEDIYYLIAVNYYSNFIVVDLMTTTTSTRVIAILKK